MTPGDPSCKVQLQLSVHFGFPAWGDGELEDAQPVRDAPGGGTDALVPGSAGAVAETGTIILDGSPNRGVAISLVPDHHICVVKAADVTGILPEALRRIDGTRPLTMISGPSATSDIEPERVEGVHGPRRLDVLIAR